MADESAGTTSWIDRELAGSTFRDKRLGDRLRTLLEGLPWHHLRPRAIPRPSAAW